MKKPKLSPSRFYSEFLKAPLINDRWSWGAVRPHSDQLFLRIWKDLIVEEPIGSRAELLKVSKNTSNPGYNERVRHIELLRNGYQGYGVLCTVRDPAEKPRKIRAMDQSNVAVFGGMSEYDGKIFATITGYIPVSDVLLGRGHQDRTVQDIQEILTKPAGETSKQVLADARIGQGKFRNDVLAKWSMRCCVTGSQLLDVIRASHIKPWKDSTNAERLDGDNGLPLVANLDALFDAGLMTFNHDGEVVISERVPRSDWSILQLTGLRMQRAPSSAESLYLAFHREHVFI